MIIVARNAEDFVAQAIGNILSQSHSEIELVFRDDDSNDSTYEVIRSFDDPRVTILRNDKPLGAGALRNCCIDYARGDYSAVMDANDVATPQRIRTQVAYLEQFSGVIACGTAYEMFGEKERVVRTPISAGAIRADLLFTLPLCYPSLMLRASALRRHRVRYSALPMAQDYAFVLQLSRFGEIRNLSSVGLHFRVRHASLGNRNRIEHQGNVGKTYRQYLPDIMGRAVGPREPYSHGILAARRSAEPPMRDLGSAIRCLMVLLTATRTPYLLMAGVKRVIGVAARIWREKAGRIRVAYY